MKQFTLLNDKYLRTKNKSEYNVIIQCNFELLDNL